MSSTNSRPYFARANNAYVVIRRQQRNINRQITINRQRRIQLQIQMMQSLQDNESNQFIELLFDGGSFNP